MRADGRLVR